LKTAGLRGAFLFVFTDAIRDGRMNLSNNSRLA